MNPILQGFLRATAVEDWDLWYGDVRLMFADFCGETGRDGAETLLRTMPEPEATEEIDNSGRRVLLSVELGENSAGRSGEAESVWIGGVLGDGTVMPVYEATRRALQTFEYAPAPALNFPRLRLSIQNPGDVRATYRVRSRDGEWRGILSADRARRACRRNVLAMFSAEMLEASRSDQWGTAKALALALMPEVEPSPVWHAYARIEPGFEGAYEAGRQTAYERERRMLDVFLGRERVKDAPRPYRVRAMPGTAVIAGSPMVRDGDYWRPARVGEAPDGYAVSTVDAATGHIEIQRF